MPRGEYMKKILIVDDQSEIRELVDITLKSDDYDIFQAESGQKAIEIARRERPDLIIMDIAIPGGTEGIETTRTLKNDPETKNCKIIMLTGRGLETDRKKSLDAGADDFFTKPFSPLALIKKVEEVLG
jgi:DNA-binding response OmpR family regulator